MINEENSLNALKRTYIGQTLAHTEKTNPAMSDGAVSSTEP